MGNKKMARLLLAGLNVLLVFFTLPAALGLRLSAQDEPRPFIEPLEIYAGAIDGLHQYDGKGRYDQLLLKMKPNSDVPFDLIVQPIGRAIRNFENCTNCCASPTTNDPEFHTYENTLASAPMGSAKLYAFTQPGTKPISTIDQLTGLKVGAKLGAHLGQTVSRTVELTLRATNLADGIQLLLQERLDAFLAYTPDAYVVFDQLDMRPLPHDQMHPLVIHRDSVVCRGPNRQRFINAFNEFLHRTTLTNEHDSSNQ